MTTPTGSGHLNPNTNASGTRLAAARSLGTGPAVNLTDPARDATTLVPHNGGWITVKSGILMGVLSRTGATLTENNPAAGSARTW